jgi:hypothetical protein
MADKPKPQPKPQAQTLKAEHPKPQKPGEVRPPTKPPTRPPTGLDEKRSHASFPTDPVAPPPEGFNKPTGPKKPDGQS